MSPEVPVPPLYCRSPKSQLPPRQARGLELVETAKPKQNSKFNLQKMSTAKDIFFDFFIWGLFGPWDLGFGISAPHRKRLALQIVKPNWQGPNPFSVAPERQVAIAATVPFLRTSQPNRQS